MNNSPPIAPATSFSDSEASVTTRNEAGLSTRSQSEATQSTERPWAAFLFALTLCTTFLAGLTLSPEAETLRQAKHVMGFDFQGHFLPWYRSPSVILQALSFPLAILGILGCHELGHFLQARRQGVKVSLPFFIPSVPPLGTLGAVIRMHVDKGIRSEALLKVAAGGPIAGMVPAVIALLVGLSLSEVRPLPFDVDTVLQIRGGLLMLALERAYFGVIPEGYDIYLHPIAFAGWAGCFVTALNMLPAGQLDGGHVIYALMPRRSTMIARLTVGALLVAGLFYVGWWIFAAMIVGVIGVKHPPMCSDGGATGRVRWQGWVALILFACTIHPVPITQSDVVSLWQGIADMWPYLPLQLRDLW